tara:strand:+ start:723 stop:1319 length:597 start_codon:yes stop_codon:yes gene_type:complete
MINKKINNLNSPNFIGCWDIDNNELCNNIINFFENNEPLQKKGSTGLGVNEKIKKSTDITIDPHNLTNPKYKLFNDYIKNLNDCFLDYKNQYPFIKTFLNKSHIGHFNIQKYLPGDHFSFLHSERTGISSLHRIFAWMTYLNDVSDGGTTDFEYFNIKIKPEVGKTLIWPAEWTHAHTGSILNSGSKYIITGWIHFAD